MKPWQVSAAAALGGRLLDTLLATVRFETEGEEHLERLRSAGRPFIYVLWHGRLLPLTYHHRDQDITTLVSRSSDGELIARVVHRWGYHTVRGSSSRGGTAAVRALARAARAGRTLAITPDGPRGPRQKMKPGALMIAQLAGVPLLPLTATATRTWWTRGGWDRFMVPKPFARVRVIYGEPIHVPAGVDETGLARIADRVEHALNTLDPGVATDA